MTPAGAVTPAGTAGLAGVVLAAGSGRRLAPLTDAVPKALVEVGGAPLLHGALTRLEAVVGAGPGRVAVNAHHLADQVVAAVGARAHVVVEAPVALGTAGALAGLAPWIAGRDVLVTNADTWSPRGPALLVGLAGGWDGRRCRLLCGPAGGARADFTTPDGQGVRYLGSALLPAALLAGLEAVPSGLYEVLWRDLDAAGRLDLVVTAATVVDCGTPGDLARARELAGGALGAVPTPAAPPDDAQPSTRPTAEPDVQPDAQRADVPPGARPDAQPGGARPGVRTTGAIPSGGAAAADTVVVVMGVSGSGKTTVARALAERLGWPFAEADDFHPPANIEKMTAGTALTDEDRWPWLEAVRDWLTARASDGQGAVVTCSALKRSYRDLLRTSGGRVLFLHLTGERDVLASRMGGRSGHFMPSSLLDSQLATLQPLGGDEPGLGASVLLGPEEIVEAAVRELHLG